MLGCDVEKVLAADVEGVGLWVREVLYGIALGVQSLKQTKQPIHRLRCEYDQQGVAFALIVCRVVPRPQCLVLISI